MKRLLLYSCMILVAFNVVSRAGDKGPTLTTVTESILNFMDDGKWYPKTVWNILGMQNGEELKTTIKDMNGKIVADATWQFTANYDGEWAKVTDCLKFSPTGHPSTAFDKLPLFAPGNYKLEIYAGGKLIWETPFEITKTVKAGKARFACTGPWTDIAYIYEDDGSNGGIVSFWFGAPTDVKWFWENNDGYERSMELRSEVIKNGEVLITKGPEQYDQFRNFPGQARKFGKSVAYTMDFKPKVMSQDGEYRIVIYASDQYKNQWNPIVDFTFPVVNGKIPINEEMSGAKADPLHKCITSSAYYVKGAVKNTVPNYKQ